MEKSYNIDFNTTVNARGAEEAAAAVAKIGEAAQAAEAKAAALKAKLESMAADHERAFGADNPVASIFSGIRERSAARAQASAAREAAFDKASAAALAQSESAGGAMGGNSAQNTEGFLGSKGADGASEGDGFGGLVNGLTKRFLGLEAGAGAIKNVVSGLIGPELEKLQEAWKGTLRTFSEELSLGAGVESLTTWLRDVTGATDKAKAATQEKANADKFAALQAQEVARAEREHKAQLDQLNSSMAEAARHSDALIQRRRLQAEVEREAARMRTEAQLLEIEDPTRQIPDSQRIEEAGRVKVAALKGELEEKKKTLEVDKSANELRLKVANDAVTMTRKAAAAAEAEVDRAAGLSGESGELARTKAEARFKGATEAQLAAEQNQQKALQEFNQKRAELEARQRGLEENGPAAIANEERRVTNAVNAAANRESQALETQHEREWKENAERQKREKDERQKRDATAAREGLRAGLTPDQIVDREVWADQLGKGVQEGMRGARDKSRSGDMTRAIGEVEKASAAVADGATSGELAALAEALAKLAESARRANSAQAQNYEAMRRQTEAMRKEFDARLQDINAASGNVDF